MKPENQRNRARIRELTVGLGQLTALRGDASTDKERPGSFLRGARFFRGALKGFGLLFEFFV